MKKRSLKNPGIAIGLVATAVIMGSVLGSYIGRLDNTADVIVWMTVAAGVTALCSCVATGMAIYRHRQHAKARAE